MDRKHHMQGNSPNQHLLEFKVSIPKVNKNQHFFRAFSKSPSITLSGSVELELGE
jgi:hypothetical protein